MRILNSDRLRFSTFLTFLEKVGRIPTDMDNIRSQTRSERSDGPIGRFWVRRSTATGSPLTADSSVGLRLAVAVSLFVPFPFRTDQ